MDSKLHTPIEWASIVSETLMKQYKAEELRAEELYVDEHGRYRLDVWNHEEEFADFLGKRWRYNHGLFMVALQRLYEVTGNEKFYNYTKLWADDRIEADGYIELRDEIDAVQPGLALFMLYDKTGDKKYYDAIVKIKEMLDTVPKTKEGGYWHKNKTPDQMWLDGLYMVEPFVIHYGILTKDKEKYFKSAVHQAQLMTKYTKDEETGLLYHGYDERREEAWADKTTGRSPEFWARALGWYCVALVDILELMPKDMEGYDELMEMLVSELNAVLKYRDEKTGLWYQIVDKGDKSDNWLEFSASCLFLYSLCKAVRLGYVPESYLDGADLTYESLIGFIEYDENGDIAVEGTCMGTNVGDYNHYVNRKTVTNDFHGVGAFVMALVEYDKKNK